MTPKRDRHRFTWFLVGCVSLTASIVVAIGWRVYATGGFAGAGLALIATTVSRHRKETRGVSAD